jgi:hypothetical protein
VTGIAVRAQTDNFLLLNEPRRPWIDEERLKSRFHELSLKVHPDRVHESEQGEKQAANQCFADLSAAYQCLSNARLRLRHLLTLELGCPPTPIEQVPGRAMDYYFAIAESCREADRFLASTKDASSPLLKVRRFQESMEHSEKLKGLLEQLFPRRAALLDELKTLNCFWETAPEIGAMERVKELPLERLEQIYRTISYIDRWSGQIQQRVTRLAM